MILYYAHPIDQATTTNSGVEKIASQRGVVLFDPAGGWRVPPGAQPQPEMQQANLDVLRRCDGVIAYLDQRVLSIGVTIELVEAHNHGIPALVYGDLKPSWALTYLGIEQTKDLDRVARWMEGLGKWS